MHTFLSVRGRIEAVDKLSNVATTLEERAEGKKRQELGYACVKVYI